MLKSLTITYLGKSITLECTHKRQFPPPQMFGHTPQDIDVLWRQGAISQTQYQLLKTWQEHCGIMMMGPRCVDCPLAKKQNPRPGRPHVITTEPWLPAKEKIHWELKKAAKEAEKNGVPTEGETVETLIQSTLNLTDEEIEKEFQDNGENLSEVAHRVRENLLNVVDEYIKRNPQDEEEPPTNSEIEPETDGRESESVELSGSLSITIDVGGGPMTATFIETTEEPTSPQEDPPIDSILDALMDD